MQKTNVLIGVALIIVAGVYQSASSAELRLRSEARTLGSVIRLGDVADILGGESEVQTLGQIELAPAPAAGKQRGISVREVQDTLERRGLNMTQLRISGASQVTVVGFVEAVKPAAKKTLPLSSTREAQRAVTDAIVRRLQECTPGDDPWKVDLDLTDAQSQLVLADVHHLEVSGGQDPWLGRQTFEITVRTDRGPSAFTVETKVTVPSAVVVTAKPVPRGSILQSGDVTLQRLKLGTPIDDAFQSLDDVIGREAVRAIAPGQILDPQYVRTPIYVKRGSVVTVYVQSPGVKIRTTGRARDNGSQGEIVTVESLLDRKSFEARVTGIDQVQIDANPTIAPQVQSNSKAEVRSLPVTNQANSTRFAAARNRDTAN